jgi:hypothetical protein
VEASLVDLLFQDFPAGLEVVCVAQGVVGLLFLLLKGEGGGRSGKTKLEVEVQGHDLAMVGSSLDEALVMEGEGEFACP